MWIYINLRELIDLFDLGFLYKPPSLRPFSVLVLHHQQGEYKDCVLWGPTFSTICTLDFCFTFFLLLCSFLAPTLSPKTFWLLLVIFLTLPHLWLCANMSHWSLIFSAYLCGTEERLEVGYMLVTPLQSITAVGECR